jgi:hypothetical protein
MAKSDEQLLNFDKSELADWRPDKAAETLAGPDADIYRNHLHIALFMDRWEERLKQQDVASSREFHEGYIKAVQDIGAYLRQMYLMPGGYHLAQVEH